MQPLDWIVLGAAFSLVGTGFALCLFIGGKALDQDPYEIAKLGDIHLPAGFSLPVRSGDGGKASAPVAIDISKVFPTHNAGDTQ